MEKHEIEHINFLIKEIAKGDEKALNFLYGKYSARFFNVAMIYVKDYDLASDAIQETMIRIVNNAKSFRRFDNGYAWICTIIRNQCKTMLRSNKKGYDIDDYTLSVEPSNSALKNDVNNALNKLNEYDRKLIIMSYILDMSLRDIASELNESKSNIANKLKKAEEQLKQYLQ